MDCTEDFKSDAFVDTNPQEGTAVLNARLSGLRSSTDKCLLIFQSQDEMVVAAIGSNQLLYRRDRWEPRRWQAIRLAFRRGWWWITLQQTTEQEASFERIFSLGKFFLSQNC
jgi:hypothetical protein